MTPDLLNSGERVHLTPQKLLVILALCIVSVLSLVSCGGEQSATPTTTGVTGAGDPSNAQQLTITARDNVFDPKSYTAQADKPIKLTVVNAGQNIHKIEVVDVLPETELAPGQSRIVDIVPQKPGTHKVYCEIHEDDGMQGEFIVK